MRAIVLHCKPGSRFHFGKYAPDDDTALNDSDVLAHSDTLFAALVNIYQETFGDAQELVDAFACGQIRVSSLLYCLQQKDHYTWLLPKPVCFNLFETENYKDYRAIRFITKKLWENLSHPTSLTDPATCTLFSNGLFATEVGEIILPEGFDKSEKKQWLLNRIQLSRLITLPKVRVRDTPEEQGIFQLTVSEVCDNSRHIEGFDLPVHFYFLLDEHGLPTEIIEKVESIIKMLPYTGIGAEKSTIGKIEGIEIIDNWKTEIHDADMKKMATVSLFAPTPNDKNKMYYYKTLMRGGRRLGRKDDKTDIYLKSVRMISEGAILSTDAEGSLADVSPSGNKTYLRNGKPLGLPVRSQWIPKYEP